MSEQIASGRRRATRADRPKTHAEINEFRRRTLIEGAIDSLAEHGVTGTTVRTICDAAGSSRGLIGHYFENKEELLAAALRYLFLKISNQVRETVEGAGTSAVARLKAYPEALFAPQTFTERNRTAFLSLWHEVRFNKAVRQANQELYDGYVERIETLFGDAAKQLGVRMDVRRSALGLIGLTDGMWLGMSIHDEVASADQAVEICHRFIDQELVGHADRR
jgi:AcrR family transcriptional regulator